MPIVSAKPKIKCVRQNSFDNLSIVNHSERMATNDEIPVVEESDVTVEVSTEPYHVKKIPEKKKKTFDQKLGKCVGLTLMVVLIFAAVVAILVHQTKLAKKHEEYMHSHFSTTLTPNTTEVTENPM